MSTAFHDPARLSLADELRVYTQRFILHPKHLLGFSLKAKLEWRRIPFDKANLGRVTDRPGVYAFAVSSHRKGLPPHDYVLYVGQAGAKRQERTLRQRMREYLREKGRPKRPHVHYFLNKWSGCLSLHYAVVAGKKAELLAIEAKLNDALMPPYAIKDFSAEIRKRKALWALT